MPPARKRTISSPIRSGPIPPGTWGEGVGDYGSFSPRGLGIQPPGFRWWGKEKERLVPTRAAEDLIAARRRADDLEQALAEVKAQLAGASEEKSPVSLPDPSKRRKIDFD